MAVASPVMILSFQQNADLVWNLAVSRVITEVNSSPSFPLPMNIFYLFSTCVTFLGTALRDKYKCCSRSPKEVSLTVVCIKVEVILCFVFYRTIANLKQKMSLCLKCRTPSKF